jgi:hypothetical protein
MGVETKENAVATGSVFEVGTGAVGSFAFKRVCEEPRAQRSDKKMHHQTPKHPTRSFSRETLNQTLKANATDRKNWSRVKPSRP